MEEHTNKVELIGTYGSDETHALSAWTSTSRELTDEKRGRMDKLLNMLAEQKHHSIFEKSMIHFLVTSELASHTHILKHRIGTSCVTGDTLIYVPRPTGKKIGSNGFTTKTIRQLYDEYTIGAEITSSTGKKYRRIDDRKTPVRTKETSSNLIGKSYITSVFHNGKREVFEFITETGKSIKTTPDHRFLSSDKEWVEIGAFLGLKVKDDVALFSNRNCYVATNDDTSEEIQFEKIVKVNYVGIEDVYDLEVEDTHNYVANGFVIHNCNTESARYKELRDDKFYVPNDWDQDEQAMLIKHCQDSLRQYHECLARLVAKGVPRKRAKESARFYLPYANQLTCDLAFNFRSFMLFMELRNSEHAQKEIRDIAQKMLILVEQTGHFKMSLDAFGWTKEKIYATVP